MLNLAAELGNVSRACKVMSFSRDTFYRYQTAMAEGGVEALLDANRKKPNIRNRIERSIELAVKAYALEQPAFGQVRVSNELRKRGVFVSASGVRCVWLRHDLESFKKRLSALEKHIAETGEVLTEAQVSTLERKQDDDAVSIDWFGTARGRIGVTMPSYSNFLIYRSGGFAYGYVNNTVGIGDIWGNQSGSGYSGSGAYSDTKLGWAAGGGIEWSPQTFPSWSAKVEYLYTNLGSANQSVWSNYAVGNAAGYSFVANQSTPTQFQTIRAGLNWHFNPFVGEPIVAKY